MRFILRWLINTGALMLLPYILPGISVRSFYSALIMAAVYGLIIAIIRPILVILTLPINLLTLGFFTLIINALLFWFASTIVKGFDIHGILTIFLAALIMSLVGTISGWFLKK